MRLALDILLLLVQLRPLAAGVVCLEQTMQSEECMMPGEKPGVSESSEPTTRPHTCPDAILCSPLPPAILESSRTVVGVRQPAALRPGLMATAPAGPALAPPFHHPRV